MKAISRPDERWARRDIKTTQLLPNVLVRTEAKKAGALEAWLVDDDGFVTEGAVANAWIVDADGHVVTRALSHDVLPGVTRQVVLEAAAEAQLPVIQRKFTIAEVLAAKEAFITSSTSTAIGGGGAGRQKDRQRGTGAVDPADSRPICRQGWPKIRLNGLFLFFRNCSNALCWRLPKRPRHDMRRQA